MTALPYVMAAIIQHNMTYFATSFVSIVALGFRERDVEKNGAVCPSLPSGPGPQVYSFGVLLWQMYTGKTPFAGHLDGEDAGHAAPHGAPHGAQRRG